MTTMSIRHSTVLAVALLGFLGVAPLAQAACEGVRVDGTTADWAQAKAKAAGYGKVTGLRKGCDSVWHGQTSKGGSPVNLMISPKGEVLEEGN